MSLAPTSNPKYATYRGLLTKYVRPQWRRASLMIVLLLIGIALQLLNPQILRYFIDAATTGTDTTILILSGTATHSTPDCTGLIHHTLRPRCTGLIHHTLFANQYLPQD